MRYTSPAEVEAAFYASFKAADLELMMSLWAPSSDIVCVHPGSAALKGQEAINKGWAYIFEGGPVQIEFTPLYQIESEQMAWHGVEERLIGVNSGKTTTLFASHLFVKTSEGWRLTLHHAGVSMPGMPDAERLLH